MGVRRNPHPPADRHLGGGSQLAGFAPGAGDLEELGHANVASVGFADPLAERGCVVYEVFAFV